MSLSSIALIASTALSVGASIFGGVSEKRASDDQAELLQEQARLEREQAETEAQRKEEERTKFIAKQKVAFLANGVGLAGTPLVVLEDSFQQFNKEIASIRRSGTAQAKFLEKEADIKKRSGKAALISGVIGAGSSIAGNIFKGKTTGVF